MERWDSRVLHEQVLYPTVRVRCKNAGGSGTVLFSGKNKQGEYETYILTNYHVIESAIEVKKQWDSMFGREIKKEFKSTVQVDFFKYKYDSIGVGAQTIDADIVAYDAPQDLALLKLRAIDKVEYVANIFPPDRVKDEIRIFDEVIACGAALGAPPLPTMGFLSNLNIEIDNYIYWLSTALTIYGNSGGALYRWSEERERWELIGVPSRIQVILSGFMAQAITHMGYAIPILSDRGGIIRFLEDWCYQFIYDPNYTIEQCAKLREEKKRKAEEEMKRIYGVVEESE